MNKFLTALKYLSYIYIIAIMYLNYGTGIAGLAFMIFSTYELNNLEWKNQHKHNMDVLNLTSDIVKDYSKKQLELDIALKEVERDVDLIKERLG